MKRCSAIHVHGSQCERDGGHLLTDEALEHRYHAAAGTCWIRHGDYDLSWPRCVVVADGKRCVNLAIRGCGSSECGEQHRWALADADQNHRDAQEADAKDLLHSLGAP